MRFLNRNHYCIWFSNRCNYSCSYCINRASVDAPYSVVEQNPSALVKLFNSVDPGVIMVSGGEPVLWADMPHLIDALEQHYWVILSNLSIVPDWLRHERVKLVVAAYHPEYAKLNRFVEHARSLPRVVVKVLVHPHKQRSSVRLWSQLWTKGIVTHLVPLEWPRGHTKEFLDRFLDVSGDLLTSCMYNSRFFSGPVDRYRLCIAGTQDMFQVNPGGDLGRCSQAGSMSCSIFEPVFSNRAEGCSGPCYCEWHHWSEAALANDNDSWNHFVDTGVWKIPTVADFVDFVERMGWEV